MRSVLLTLALIGCQEKGPRADSDSPGDSEPGPDTGAPAGVGSLQGRVVDPEGAPISGATVEADGQRATTDGSGWFYLDAVTASDALVVSATGEGWSTNSARVAVRAERWAYAHLTLLPATVLRWDPEEGPTISTEEGVEIQLPEAGLVDAEGAPVTGPFWVTVAFLDVREGLDGAPGRLAAITSDGEIALRSGGMVEVRLTDDAGAPLQISGPAVLSFPVPDEVDPEGLGTWGFDEELGLWTALEGGAVADGRFSAEVPHFSWWNADGPVNPRQCVVGQVLDPGGRPLEGLGLTASDPTEYMLAEATTDREGRFQIDATPGSTITVSLAWGAWLWEGATVTTSTDEAVAIPEDCLDLGEIVATDLDVDDDGYLTSSNGGNDCDDTRAEVHPRAREVWYDGLDQDCDGNDGDQDEDGYLAAAYVGSYTEGFAPGDCDDMSAAIHPDAAERCDGVDDNCSGDESDAADAGTWYRDDDGDGYGQTDAWIRACEATDGYASEDGDCDDTGADAASVHPSADVSCTDGDFNCDGVADQVDADGDGVLGCEGDCDDSSPAVYPSAADLCDGLDNDCDGVTDGDSAYYTASYPDLDGDGFGDDASASVGCEAPAGFIPTGGDCDDTDAARWSGADEVCDDGRVNDCDGDADAATEACDWDSEQSLSTVGLAMTGEAAYDYAGSAVARAGDADGDGVPDLLVGATRHEEDRSSGAAYLVLGAPDAEGSVGDLAWATLIGETSSAHAGSSVCTAGDQDGDGLDDLIVGSANLSVGASQGGGAYVVYGLPVGTVDLSTAEMAFYGDTYLLQAGDSVSGGSDLDGDGLPEVAIGGTGYPGRGYGEGAFVLLGPVSGTLGPADADLSITDGATGTSTGGRVLLLGDTDGDGLGDLLAGSTSATISGVKSGAAFLFVNPGTGTLSVDDADATIRSDAADRVGYLFEVGDLDGDGLADVGVTAKLRSGGAGVAGVWLSPLSGTVLHADADLSVTGSSASSLGGRHSGQDVNGDGALDLLVGAPNDGTAGGAAGAAALYYGPRTGALTLDDADVLLLGGTKWSGDYAGVSGAMVGDLDGDGRSELLIGATGYDTPNSDGGAAFLVHVAGY